MIYRVLYTSKATLAIHSTTVEAASQVVAIKIAKKRVSQPDLYMRWRATRTR